MNIKRIIIFVSIVITLLITTVYGSSSLYEALSKNEIVPIITNYNEKTYDLNNMK